jgi:hypothetical protein
MSSKYTIVKFSPNTWNSDGSPIIERESTTTHRSLRAAEKKHRELIGYNRKAGTWSAQWHGSQIVAITETGYRSLTPEEEEAIYNIEYERNAI